MKLPLLSALLALVASVPLAAADTKQPNIIFILADDYGVGEVSCYGADNYRTPNIDSLARHGLRFTNAYTAPLCGPSRAVIMTGRYAFRTGATNQDSTGEFQPSAEKMLPSFLKPAGYVTSMVGKWGQLPLGPAEFGFDDYLKFKGSGAYWNTQAKAKTYEVNGTTVPLRDREYLPDVMHQHVVEFITRHQDRPFFLYYSLSHVHNEILPTPDSAPDSKDVYGDNITYMDKLVGQLMDELDRLKLREKTLVVFFGDNGTAGKRAPQATIGGRPIIGAKGSMQEGGALVPLIVSWPGHVKPGQTTAQLVDSSDFLPTFAALAGAKLPENIVLDGHSFAARLHGDAAAARDHVFIQLARMWWVRDSHWKLNEKGELFDMSEAPFAETKISADSADPAAHAARERLGAELAKLNPAGGIIDKGDGTGRHAKNAGREEGADH